MKKILILSTIYPSKVDELSGKMIFGKFIRDFAIALRKAGFEVHVLTPHQHATKKDLIEEGIFIHRFHYFFKSKWETLTYGSGIPENIKKLKNKLLVPFLILGFLLNTFKLVNSRKIDILNGHWVIPNGFVAAIIGRLLNVITITTAYGAELLPVQNGKMKVLLPFIKYSVKNVDYIASISENTANSVKSLTGHNDVQIIPDGIDVDYYKPDNKNHEVLRKYNAENRKIIFFTGRMVERKGHRHLLESIHYVISDIPDVKLILGGRGPLFNDLIELRKKHDLEDYVEMPGFIPEEEVVPLLQSADLYVLPSCVDDSGDTEGSATAALEAMACGTPAMISEVGGNIGSINNGYGAYYFPPGHSQYLAEKIIHFFSNKQRFKLKEDARTFIEDKYSWEKIVKMYIKLIDGK